MARARNAQLTKSAYRQQLHKLSIELVALQKHVIAKGLKVVLVIEGRDAAGKDGLIKTITRHLSPRETRVVAVGKPSDRETTQWYFQRWANYLPGAGEILIFNRSWYNRAGVERVMGFCTKAQYRSFLEEAPLFEDLLARNHTTLIKYYLDISKDEQRKRLEDRKRDPLKQWKISPIDAKALEMWDEYSKARDTMLERTHTAWAPWSVVHSDDKRRARLETIRDLLSRIDYDGARDKHRRPDPAIVERYSPEVIERLAH